MIPRRIAAAAVFAVAAICLPVAPAAAQPYCYYPYYNPIFLPFQIAAAAVGTAAAIVTAPVALITNRPVYWPAFGYCGTAYSPYLGYPPPPPYNPALANQYAPPPGYYGYYGQR
jgi:hypothetical protein